MSKENLRQNLDEVFKNRDEFFAMLDRYIPKKPNSNIFDFDKVEDKSLKEVYEKFYAYDYSVRKLMPDLFGMLK